MQLPTTKIEAACADKKEIRAYLRQPWLDVEGKRIMATDGGIMAVVPIETADGDTTGQIPVEALKAARRDYKRFTDNPELIKANGSCSLPNGFTVPREDVGKYPNIDQIIPKDRSETPDICLNADLLARLQEALSAPDVKHAGLRLFFAHNADGSIDPGAAVLVRPFDQTSGSVGVIMPMRDKDS